MQHGNLPICISTNALRAGITGGGHDRARHICQQRACDRMLMYPFDAAEVRMMQIDSSLPVVLRIANNCARGQIRMRVRSLEGCAEEKLAGMVLCLYSLIPSTQQSCNSDSSTGLHDYTGNVGSQDYTRHTGTCLARWKQKQVVLSKPQPFHSNGMSRGMEEGDDHNTVRQRENTTLQGTLQPATCTRNNSESMHNSPAACSQ